MNVLFCFALIATCTIFDTKCEDRLCLGNKNKQVHFVLLSACTIFAHSYEYTSMKASKKIIIPLCLIVVSFTASGQRSFQFDAADRLFSEGKDFFELKNYPGSTDKLEAYKKVATNRDLVQEAEYMLAYIDFVQGKESAVETLEAYLKTYPDSRHGDEACLLIGTGYFEKGDYVKARNWLADARVDALSDEQREVLYYRLAYSQMQNDDLVSAKENFAIVSEMSGEYSQASTYYIAYINYATGRYDEALKEFSRLRRQDEYVEQANYYIAQIHYIEGRDNEVVKLAERLLRTYPNSEKNVELYRIAGNSYYRLGNRNKAISMLRNYVSSVDVPARGELYLLGICEYTEGNYQEAVNVLSRTITDEDMLTQNASLYLGHSYLRLDDKRSARMAFDHAGSMTFNRKTRETALYNYALLIHETSFTGFGESVKAFESFLNDFPESEYSDKVNDYLVEVYLTSKNYEAALESINKIRKPSIRVLEAKQNILFQLGNQAFMNTNMPGAIDYFNRTIELGNYDSDARANAYLWRGESYYRLGRYTDAISDYNAYQNAARSSTSGISSLVYYNLGYCYFKRQDFDQALLSFRRYVSLERDQRANSYADAYNRIGDCLYYNRRFAEAEENYSRAMEIQPSMADYAIYQKGAVLGLQKNYRGKIQMLDRLIKEFPESQYVDDAYFERGRSYVLLDMNSEAALSFNMLVDLYPQSSYAPKAGVQLGLLYYNDNRLDNSIAAYKRVIENYPGSEEAKVAIQDLRSVYIDKNDVNSYATYVNSLSGSNIRIEVSEQDSLTYIAAERLFLRGDFSGALSSMTEYLRLYPVGAFSPNANYYLAKIAFDRKNYAEAKRLFVVVLNSGDAKFREESLARKSEIEYLEKDYSNAIKTFRELQQVAESRENREAAKLGIMRCAQYTGNEAEALEAANELLKETNLSPEIEAEARYLRAKSYLKLGEGDKALGDFTALSKDTRTVYGAEAKYQLAQLYYNKKDVARAEKELLNFIENGTPHQYWLARGFILLADIYIDKGDEFQARQYLTSLKRNYSGSEDIDRMIENRLEKLKK